MGRSFSKLTVRFSRNEESSPRSYPIYIGSGMLSTVGAIASEQTAASRIAIVTDENVEKMYAEQVQSSLVNFGFNPFVISLPPGEDQKTLENVRLIYDTLHEKNCGRDSAIIALGGGVIGDLAGFAAASYYRGIQYAHIPTTLISQVDSSVGGKTGVNLPYGKNLIGAFYQPTFVFIDVNTLRSLPKRQLRSGVAEVMKYGAILDQTLVTRIEKSIDDLLQPNLDLYPDIIQRCCELKAMVVGQDERESGYREILNFGHTIGHALETATRYQVFTHGEAIAYGMIAETWLSVMHCGFPEDTASRLCSLFMKIEPPPIPSFINEERIYQSMFSDKKMRSGRLRFSLITNLGEATFGETPDEQHIKQSIQKLLEMAEDQWEN